MILGWCLVGCGGEHDAAAACLCCVRYFVTRELRVSSLTDRLTAVRRAVGAAFLSGAMLVGVGQAQSADAAAACARGDFEAVVDAAAGALRDLNQANKPQFQGKLRTLKDKRGWSHADFLKKAAPFVSDDNIALYDQTSQALLGEIARLGQEGSEAQRPDCSQLDGLRQRMDKLVAAQKAKWSYMFTKIDKELSQ